MSESKENAQLSPEIRSSATSEAAAERSKELSQNPEKSSERPLSESAERSKVDALFSKETSVAESKKSSLDASGAPKPLPRSGGRKDREASYRKTLAHIGTELSPHERLFSKAIHNPAVEKASEALGSTIARPNAILAGSFTAFIAVTAVYVIARNMGYPLSGFETIGTFILGWTVGIIYDYVRIMVSGKPS